MTPEPVLLRANPWSAGDGLRLGLAAGASLTDGHGRVLGPRDGGSAGGVGPGEFRSLGQSYARFSTVTNERGEVYEPRTWSEIDVAQWIARQPGGRAWLAVPDAALGEHVRTRTVAEMIEAARAAGAPVERRDGETVVEVVAGITTTLGGLAIDTNARTADNVWAAGADAGGISTGGWTSTLASPWSSAWSRPSPRPVNALVRVIRSPGTPSGTPLAFQRTAERRTCLAQSVPSP